MLSSPPTLSFCLSLTAIWACGGPEAREPTAPAAATEATTVVLDPPRAPSSTSAPAGPPSTTAAPTVAEEPPTDAGPEPDSAQDTPQSEANSSLTASDIMAVFRAVRAPVQRKCGATLEAGSPPVRLAAALTIGKDGKVTAAQVDGTEGQLAACVVREMRALKFPPSSGETRVKVPFVFRK